MEYFDTLHDKAELSGKYIRCTHDNTDNWLDYETLCKATTFFNQAIAVAEQQFGKNSEFVHRLRRERLPLELVWLKGHYKFKRIAELKGEEFFETDPVEACKEFFAICEKYNVAAYREFNTPEMFAQFRESMFRRFGNPASVSEEFKKLDPYKKIEFEPLPLSQTMYIWFAPPKREGEVQAVYIDRVLIIRE